MREEKLILVISVISGFLMVSLLVSTIAFYQPDLKYGLGALNLNALFGVKKTEVQTNTQTILAEAQKQDIINAIKPELEDYINTKTDALRTELKGYTDQKFNSVGQAAQQQVVAQNHLNCRIVQPGANGNNTGDAICARLNGQGGINNLACVGAIKHDRFNTFSDSSCRNMNNSSNVTDLVSCSEQQLSESETACGAIGNNTWRKIKSFDGAICCSIN